MSNQDYMCPLKTNTITVMFPEKSHLDECLFKRKLQICSRNSGRVCINDRMKTENSNMSFVVRIPSHLLWDNWDNAFIHCKDLSLVLV